MIIKTVRQAWKKMLLIFVIVTIIISCALGLLRNEEIQKNMQKIEYGKVIWFDLTSYSYLGDGTALIYDYTTVWQDEVLLFDLAERLDNTEGIYKLDNGWDAKSTDDKISWLTDNITIQRLATSSMYRVSLEKEVEESEIDTLEAAMEEVLDVFFDYAVNISSMSDEGIKYEFKDEFSHISSVFSGDQSNVNMILNIGVSAVLGTMTSLIYFAFKYSKNNKQKEK